MAEAKDRTLRLIVGILLVLLGIPGITMITTMSSRTMIMMGTFGGYTSLLAGYALMIGLVILGIHLIFEGLKKDSRQRK